MTGEEKEENKKLIDFFLQLDLISCFIIVVHMFDDNYIIIIMLLLLLIFNSVTFKFNFLNFKSIKKNYHINIFIFQYQM